MTRGDVLKTLIPVISDTLVVCNIGLPSQEMYALDDQPSNFYMLGTMGLASSIGLGLALAPGRQSGRYRRGWLGSDQSGNLIDDCK